MRKAKRVSPAFPILHSPFTILMTRISEPCFALRPSLPSPFTGGNLLPQSGTLQQTVPLESHPGRPTPLGPLTVWRALPARGRRLIGPWCFLDRYGPLSFTDDKPMDVAP